MHFRRPKTAQARRAAKSLIADLRHEYVAAGITVRRPRHGVSVQSFSNDRDDRLPASVKDRSWKRHRQHSWR